MMKIIQVENTNEKYINGTYKHINTGRKRSLKSIEKQKSHYTEETKHIRSEISKNSAKAKLENINKFGLNSVQCSVIMCDVTKNLKTQRNLYELYNSK